MAQGPEPGVCPHNAVQCLAQVSPCLPSRPEGAAGHTERWHTGGGHHHLGFNTHTSTNHYLGCLLAIILSGASGPTLSGICRCSP